MRGTFKIAFASFVLLMLKSIMIEVLYLSPYGLFLFSLFLVALNLEQRAFVNRFVSLQFLNLGQSVGHLGRGISPSQDRYLHKHLINSDRHPCLEWDTNPRSQCLREGNQFMVLHRAATLIGCLYRLVN
jgi:hypothetical protein